jgi:DnaJ like chaperone protein
MGGVQQVESALISDISNYLGVSQPDFSSIKAMFVKETNSSYLILEVSPDATDDEVKKAYRDMAVKFHPDKVNHLGEEVRKAAEEKFRKINEAYDQVKRERGIK